MYNGESIHRYPRYLTLIPELLCTLLVALSSVHLGAQTMRGIWDIRGRDNTYVSRLGPLRQLAEWIDGGARVRADSWLELLPSLVPALAWLALALLLALVLRNALPAVRTSSRGMLVEFAGGWVPVPWERLQALKVTSDVSGKRFVLLAEAGPRSLTGWHRLYSLFYSLSTRPGFFITSTISGFDELLQTAISESERTARAVEGAKKVQVQEDRPSLIFRLLLSPGAFFSRSAAGDAPAASAAPQYTGGPVRAVYPTRINSLIRGTIVVLAALALWRYLWYWVRFLALLFPPLRSFAPFNWMSGDPAYAELFAAFRTSGAPFLGVAGRPDLPAPWWLLVAAHLMLALTALVIFWLRDLLPDLEARDQGIAVRSGTGWKLIPWARVQAFKATELSEQSQILLLQAPGLPRVQSLTSALYDGSATPGVLVTSAISNYQPMLQHALGRLAPLEEQSGRPILQQEARSPLLYTAFRRTEAMAELAAEVKSDPSTRTLDTRLLLRTAGPMVLVALLPALLLFLGRLLEGDRLPGLGIILGAFLLWFFGMLEWPLVSLIAGLLDDNTGGGEQGNRALYLYPVSQLPRVLPLIAACALSVVGAPWLPVLAWIGAIVWAYWLTSTLFAQLYEWSSGQEAMIGGLLPVIWQMLLLLGYLLASR